MRLEKEIDQKRFSSPAHKLAINLLFTGAWMNSIISSWLKPHGLTPQQYNVLRILRGSSDTPVSLGYVQTRMLDKASNVSRLVEKLRCKGLLERHQCPSDRRAVDVTVTAEGIELLKILDQSEQNWLSSLNTLDKKKTMLLSDLLDELRG